jgi:glycosyltransferase involved in cell wall biosynthesis
MRYEISIVISLYNDLKNVIDLLDDIYSSKKKLKYFEIILIDNFKNRKKLFSEKKYKNLKYFFVNKKGLHYVRNFGAKKAKGNFICYLDDDMRLSKNWIDLIYKKIITNKNFKIFCCKVLPKIKNHKYRKFLNYFYQYCEYGKFSGIYALLDFGNKDKAIDPLYAFGNNLIINRKLILNFKGFNPDSFPKKKLFYVVMER